MPDSIRMNMIDRSFLPPGVAPKVLSFEVGLTSRYTVKILSTIKPVTKALTIKDRVRPVNNIVLPQLVGIALPDGEKCHELLFVSQKPKNAIAKIEGMIMTRILRLHATQQR